MQIFNQIVHLIDTITNTVVLSKNEDVFIEDYPRLVSNGIDGINLNLNGDTVSISPNYEFRVYYEAIPNIIAAKLTSGELILKKQGIDITEPSSGFSEEFYLEALNRLNNNDFWDYYEYTFKIIS